GAPEAPAGSCRRARLPVRHAIRDRRDQRHGSDAECDVQSKSALLHVLPSHPGLRFDQSSSTGPFGHLLFHSLSRLSARESSPSRAAAPVPGVQPARRLAVASASTVPSLLTTTPYT